MASALPDRDAGVFLYVGSRMLHGETPYQDVWDHKGPLIYGVNALGVLLDPGGERGIWLLEALTLLLTGWLCFRLLRASLGLWPAILGTALLFSGLVLVLRPGNYTEEFALLFSMLALYQVLKDPGGTPGRLGLVVVGISLGAAVLLRPNLAAIEGVVILYLAGSQFSRRDTRGALSTLGYVALGFAAVMVPVLAYLGERRAIAAAWDQVVVFNLGYLAGGITPPAAVVLEGLITLAPAGLPFLAALALAVAAVSFIVRRDRLPAGPAFKIGLVALPLEIGLVAVTGRGLTHYYIAWLPALVLLSAVLFDWVLRRSSVLSGRRGWLVIAVVVAAFSFVPARRAMAGVWHVLRDGTRTPESVKEALAPYPETYLLMWGAESAYNYLSGRASPTRYVYQYPLYACGYATPEKVAELRNDIERRLPLIIDTSPGNRRVPPLDPVEREKVVELGEECALSPAMVALMDDLWETYREVGRLSGTDWIVYQRSD